MKEKINLAVFASGAGSNAAKIIEYFQHHPHISVNLIVTNNPVAGVIDVAQKNNIEYIVINRNQFFKKNTYVKILKEKNIHYIILAGFLWKIPAALINTFPEKIINIHPALLPKYGGKGMYGNYVHEAVIKNKETQSGITIHLVDELYDHGKHLFQKKCTVESTDSPESLAQKIHTLEHQFFPKVIEEYIMR